MHTITPNSNVEFTRDIIRGTSNKRLRENMNFHFKSAVFDKIDFFFYYNLQFKDE